MNPERRAIDLLVRRLRRRLCVLEVAVVVLVPDTNKRNALVMTALVDVLGAVIAARSPDPEAAVEIVARQLRDILRERAA